VPADRTAQRESVRSCARDRRENRYTPTTRGGYRQVHGVP
jgi:hypothetical protein